jgi:hypothetical protein
VGAVVKSRRDASDPRRGLSRLEAARFVGVTPAKFDELVTDGRMPPPTQIDDEEVFDLIQLDLAFDRLSGGADQTDWRW